MSTENKDNLPLDQVAAKTAILLPHSEYLVERHDITLENNYVGLSVTANWFPDGDSVNIKVVFNVNKEQADNLKSMIEDEGIADDIDSGIGEAFETAFNEIYPDAGGVSVGRTSAKVKIIKK